MPADHPDLDADRFVADARADERIAAAARRRSLRRQADEFDTWAGMLATLAERAEVVTVELAGDRRVVGAVVLVGDDVVGLRSTAGRQVLVAGTAIAGVRIGGTARRESVTGDRPVVTGTTMDACLRRLAELRARVSLRAGSAPLQGEVASCGVDVVVLEGGDGQAVVPTANVTEIVLDEPLL